MKKTLALLIILLVTSTTFAKVEIGFSAGYGIPVFGVQDEWGFLPYASYERTVDEEYNYNYSEYKDIYPTLGKGLKLGVDISFFFNENFALYLGSGFSTLAKYSGERKSTYTFNDSTVTYNTEISGSFLPINLGFKMARNLGKVSPYLVVAPGLYIPIGVTNTETDSYGDSTKIQEYDLKCAPGFGVKSAIGFKVNMSDKVGLKFEIAPTFASARVKEVSYTDEGETYKYFFEKDTAELPEGTETTDYEHGGPKISFSSLDLNIGLVIAF